MNIIYTIRFIQHIYITIIRSTNTIALVARLGDLIIGLLQENNIIHIACISHLEVNGQVNVLFGQVKCETL